MGEDDRLKDLKDFLESTLNEFETLFKTSGGFEESQKGSGWDPARIPVDTYVVPSLPIERIQAVAESKKTSLFELPILTFVKPRADSVQTLTGPVVWFVPYWKVKGFHECFYFRGSSYKLKVPDDVLAVQIGKRVLDIIPKLREASGVMEQIKARVSSGGTTQVAERLLKIDNATELAYSFNEGYLMVDGKGQEDVEAEVFLSNDPPLKRVSGPESDAPPGFPYKVVRPDTTKEDIVKAFHERIVKPPLAFQKILTNRFEISNLSLIYLPFFEFIFGFAGRVRRLVLHGYSGEKVDDFPVLDQLGKMKL